MLDLLSVAGQLRTMRAGLASLAEETEPRVAAALSAWGEAVALGPGLADRVRRARTSWLVAEPLEPLAAYPVEPVPDYRVVASDGSQILPDHHEATGCYLVNVGLVDIDYRTGSARLGSAPEVCWAPGDLYPTFGGGRQEADGRVVGARRFAAECDALRAALSTHTLALVDGTLLLWWLEPDPVRLRSLGPHDLKTRTLESLTALLAAGRDLDAPVAGYLSSPRTTDVVSMLKVVLCTEEPVDCDRCPYVSGAKAWDPRARSALLPVPEKPCEEADPVSDAHVFVRLLEPGQRSARFRSAAKVTAAYDVPIDFVYLHAGGEIARLEFPAWVTPGTLDRLCGAVVDQCAKGLGYPVALQEAHEQAVVKASDRRAFLDLVRRQGVSAPSAKLARKRTSVL